MGKSNFLHALESKLGHLLGQVEDERREAIKIESLARTLSVRWDKIAHLDKVIEAVEFVITHYHPRWQRDTIHPIKPQVHQLPTPIGEAGRKALDVLRDATAPMRALDIAREIIRRDGLTGVNQATVTRFANTTQVNLTRYKKSKGIVDSDGEWPAKWWVIR